MPEQFGPLLADLEAKGIQNVGYEIIHDFPRWTKNRPAQQAGEEPQPQPHAAPVKDRPKGFMTEQIIAHLRRANGKPVALRDFLYLSSSNKTNSIGGTLTLLVKQKRATRVAPAMYVLGPKEGGQDRPGVAGPKKRAPTQKAPAQKAPAQKAPAPADTQSPSETVPDMILGVIKHSGQLRSKEIIDGVRHFRAGVSDGTVRSAISALLYRKKIKQFADGTYALRAGIHAPDLDELPPAAPEPAIQPDEPANQHEATATEV